MAWLLCIAVMASFGAMSILWAIFGWMLPGGAGGIIICFGEPGASETGFVRRYLFLRDLGLLNCPMILVDRGMTETERRWLNKRCSGIVIMNGAEFAQWLELERNRIDGTGIGDHPGRHRRCGVSEL